jgi:hypothetical protein
LHDRAIAKELRRGEIAAARCAEQLEHRVAVFQGADARRVAAGKIDRRARRSRQQVSAHVGPRGARAERDEQPAATLDDRRQPSCKRGRDRRVVDDHDRRAPQLVVADGACRAP